MPTPAPAAASDQSSFGGANAAQAAATNAALNIKPIVATIQVPRFANIPGTPGYDPTGAASLQPAKEPTVLSSSNITDNVIPGLNQRAAAVATKGTYVGQDNKTYYSDGSLVPAPLDAEYDASSQLWKSGGTSYGAAPQFVDNPGNDPEIAKTNELLSSMKASLDSSTLTQVNAIEAQYNALVANQAQANSDAANTYSHYQTVTGNDRRAPLNAASGALVNATYGIQQIAKLNADEDSAIAQVKTAQTNGNYQLMEKALGEVDSIRSAKQAAAQKVADTLSAANDAAQKQQLQVQTDNAIGQLVGQGVKDPAEVLKQLNAAGYNVTADQVAASLKNLVTTATPGGTYKFANNDVGTLIGAGISMPQIQAIQDYYNGKGTQAALNGLTSAQKAAVQTALVGKAPAGSGAAKTLKSGTLDYTSADLADGNAKLQASKGADNYVDPNLYLNMATAWTGSGGAIKDFLKAYPISSWVNPANTFVTPAINDLVRQDAAGTKTSSAASATDISTEINNLFNSNPS